MLQQRIPRENGGDGRWHSPDRDLAYCWPSLTQAALDGLAATNWKPWFAEYFQFAGLTEDEIGKAAIAYALYFQYVCDQTAASPREALQKAGWFDLKPAAQVALFFKLGQVATCAFFTCIRDVTPENQAPPLDQKAIYESALNAQLRLTGDRVWVRWLRRQWAYLKGA